MAWRAYTVSNQLDELRLLLDSRLNLPDGRHQSGLWHARLELAVEAGNDESALAVLERAMAVSSFEPELLALLSPIGLKAWRRVLGQAWPTTRPIFLNSRRQRNAFPGGSTGASPVLNGLNPALFCGLRFECLTRKQRMLPRCAV